MPESRPFQCRHIFPDGHRCGSKCLRHEPFCYYHHTTRKLKPRELRDPLSFFDMPPIDDRSGIQSAIALVLHRLAAGCLDPKRAGLLLYGLQIAAANLPPYLKNAPRPDQVTDIVDDPTHGLIAAEPRLDQAGFTPEPKPCNDPGCQLTAALDSQLETHAVLSPEATEPLPHPGSSSQLTAAFDLQLKNHAVLSPEATETPPHPASSSQLTAAFDLQLKNHASTPSQPGTTRRFPPQLFEDRPELQPFRDRLEGPDGRTIAQYFDLPYPETLPNLKACSNPGLDLRAFF
jgi:hypothetical protein